MSVVENESEKDVACEKETQDASSATYSGDGLAEIVQIFYGHLIFAVASTLPSIPAILLLGRRILISHALYRCVERAARSPRGAVAAESTRSMTCTERCLLTMRSLQKQRDAKVAVESAQEDTTKRLEISMREHVETHVIHQREGVCLVRPSPPSHKISMVAEQTGAEPLTYRRN